MFVAEKWVNSVVKVKRHIERVLIMKMVLDYGPWNVLAVYASHSGKTAGRKREFLERIVPLGELYTLE